MDRARRAAAVRCAATTMGRTTAAWAAAAAGLRLGQAGGSHDDDCCDARDETRESGHDTALPPAPASSMNAGMRIGFQAD